LNRVPNAFQAALLSTLRGFERSGIGELSVVTLRAPERIPTPHSPPHSKDYRCHSRARTLLSLTRLVRARSLQPTAANND
jgi:hypothetical protein